LTLLLLPVALALADPQGPAGAPPVAPAPAPVIAAGAPPAPAPAPQADAPELADPMTDPASLTAIQVQAQTQGRHHEPGDPMEGFNRRMYRVNGTLDRLFIRPAAMGYKHALPRPVRSGLRNFFSNLSEPVVFVNYLLQLRIGKAVRTVGRFTINSTIGMGGLFDIAKRRGFNLPHHRNSFGDTLAWYGVGPGPYVFLPLVGPSTLRDVLGGPFDDAFVPVLILSKLSVTPFNDWRFIAASSVIPGLDLRAESDPELKALNASAVDPYASLRSAWLQNRAAEVAELHHHAKGQPQATPELDSPLLDPAALPPVPAPVSGMPAPSPEQTPIPGQTSATISH
jgi:phospholipid-binding lipoprotein MlaA